MPYVTSDEVAKAWQVDHAKLCGKFLGHRRRTWHDNNPPPLFYLWRTDYTQYSSLAIALIPVWADQRIMYNGLLADRQTIQGLWAPVARTHACPQGFFDKEKPPPFLPRWPEDWKPRDHVLVEGGRTAQPNGDPETQDGPAPATHPGGSQGQLPYGPKTQQMQP